MYDRDEVLVGLPQKMPHQNSTKETKTKAEPRKQLFSPKRLRRRITCVYQSTSSPSKIITRLHQSTSADISEEYTNEENCMIEAEYQLSKGMNATATRVHKK